MSYIIQGFFLFPNSNEFNDFIVGPFSTTTASASVQYLEQYEDVEFFTTDTMLLTATCFWFCARLLEFFSMSPYKISISSSPNARPPSLILKENRRNIHKQPLGDVL